NRDAADTLALLLKTRQHATTVVYDGTSALEEFEKFQPDVVLLDIGLPGMNGYDVATELRSRPAGSELLLIAISGWGQDEDRRRSREAGFDHHLVKPVDDRLLLPLLMEKVSTRL